MNDQGDDQQGNQASAPDLEQLVGQWLALPDLADELGRTVKQCRQLVAERQVLTHRVGPRSVVSVPAAFVLEGELLAALPGTITVLADAGLDDQESLEWLFTPDASLPIEGAPIDMLRAGRKAEVRKRAQELAF